MTWVQGSVAFFMVWWVLFFMLLPWGIQRVENPEPGHAVGAPAKPGIWKKAIIATVLSIPLTLLVMYSMEQYKLAMLAESTL